MMAIAYTEPPHSPNEEGPAEQVLSFDIFDDF